VQQAEGVEDDEAVVVGVEVEDCGGGFGPAGGGGAEVGEGFGTQVTNLGNLDAAGTARAVVAGLEGLELEEVAFNIAACVRVSYWDGIRLGSV